MKWFRWHRGCVENPVLAVVALKASMPSDSGEGDRVRGTVSLTDVIAVWACVLEDAASDEHWGYLKRDATFIATVLRWHAEEVQQVLDALEQEGLIDPDGHINKWEEYQYATDADPTNALRQRRYYNKHKRHKAKPNGDLTATKRPDTDTDTDTDKTLSSPSGDVNTSGEVSKAFANYNIAANQLGLPVARTLTSDRRRKIRARLDEHGLVGWNQALQNLCEQPFCLGQGGRGWKANLDFLLQPASFNKVLEKAYLQAEDLAN